jgi:hypothetical protein
MRDRVLKGRVEGLRLPIATGQNQFSSEWWIDERKVDCNTVKTIDTGIGISAHSLHDALCIPVENQQDN